MDNSGERDEKRTSDRVRHGEDKIVTPYVSRDIPGPEATVQRTHVMHHPYPYCIICRQNTPEAGITQHVNQD